MKIGAFVPQGWRMDLNNLNPTDEWEIIKNSALKIETLGYESLWVYDHFHTVPSPTIQPTYECWTLMSALSQITSSIRLGQMCTCNSYRNPAYLTKIASNIDVMSNGRLEFAIGAGWYDQEYKAYGYDYPSDGTRLKMLEESIKNIKDVAYYWATVSAENKGVSNTVAEGEEWLGGPFATVFGIHYYIDTLKDLNNPLNKELFNNNLNKYKVFPNNFLEKIFFPFISAEIKFSKIEGIIKTEVGYCGGKNPITTYKEVCTGNTNHAEVVKIEFDEKIISYSEIVEKFFELHDPTTLNRQGPDIGTQYRSEIFFIDDEQKKVAEEIKLNKNKNYNGK